AFDFDLDLNDEMDAAKEALENAKIEMRISLEETGRSLEEMEKEIHEKVSKKIEIEMQKLKDEREGDDKNKKEIHKRVIIKKKTSDLNLDTDDQEMPFVRIDNHPGCFTTVSSYSADSDEPIVISKVERCAPG